MAWGMRITNDNGSLQIDQDFMNLCYKSKFTVTGISRYTFNLTYMGGDLGGSSDPAGPGTFYVVDYPVANNAVVAVRPPAGIQLAPVNLLNETATGSPPPTGYKRLVFTAPGSTIYTITVYVFDSQAQTLSGTNYGLIVKNAAGTIVFNSNSPPVRVVRAINIGGVYEGNSYTVSSSKTYAFMYPNPSAGSYFPASTSPRPARTSCLYQPNSTTIQVGWAPYFIYNPAGAGSLSDFNPAFAMAVDVSNL